MTYNYQEGTYHLSKNTTHISSILGTWTGQTHLKTNVGSYELLAYFVVHFMPDPMRGYGCTLKDCIEEHNQVCEVKQDSNDPVCSNLAGHMIDWSDINAFIYFGARIDAGFPFNKHRAEDTGGWVGPLNIIMASADIPDPHPNLDNSTIVVDRYVSRYVNSPLTKFLKMPTNCSLLGEDDFNKVAGPIAVESTTKGQYDPNRNPNNDKDYDPYHDHLNTCDNGDVQPILPLFQFDFEQNVASKEESIQVKLDYKFLTMPNKDDYMYKLFPMVQRRFNKADLGFHISGPYCYGNDPNRGYTFDMNFDTRDPKAMLTLTHGCIEGLPCTPPAAELYDAKGRGSDVIPNVIPNGDGATVDVGSSMGLIGSNVLLLLLLIYTCCFNSKLRKQLKESDMQQSNSGDQDDEDTEIYTNEEGHHEDNVDTQYSTLEETTEDDEEAVIDDITSSTPLISKKGD